MTADAELDKKICDVFWQMLEVQDLSAFEMAAFAQETGCTPEQLAIRAADPHQLCCFVLEYYDRVALEESALDFADAGDATTYEKILEGLIHRFEVLAPYRKGFEKLHQHCLRQPMLGVMLSFQLQGTIGKLLSLSGDNSSGLIRMARIKGIFGVFMRVRKTWLTDESADLSQTLNVLDKTLRDAQEWAVSLRVLSADEVHQEGE